ncbi:hypothetical protein, partial [Moraxella lacunata]
LGKLGKLFNIIQNDLAVMTNRGKIRPRNFKIRACLPFVFAMKNEKNRTFFKEKVKFDSRSIKQAFDEEKQSDHLTM